MKALHPELQPTEGPQIFFKAFYLYFWLPWVFVAVRKPFSCCSDQGLLSSCGVRGLIELASLAAENGL